GLATIRGCTSTSESDQETAPLAISTDLTSTCCCVSETRHVLRRPVESTTQCRRSRFRIAGPKTAVEQFKDKSANAPSSADRDGGGRCSDRRAASISPPLLP